MGILRAKPVRISKTLGESDVSMKREGVLLRIWKVISKSYPYASRPGRTARGGGEGKRIRWQRISNMRGIKARQGVATRSALILHCHFTVNLLGRNLPLWRAGTADTFEHRRPISGGKVQTFCTQLYDLVLSPPTIRMGEIVPRKVHAMDAPYDSAWVEIELGN